MNHYKVPKQPKMSQRSSQISQIENLINALQSSCTAHSAFKIVWPFISCNLSMPNVKYGSKMIWPDKPTIRTEGDLIHITKGTTFSTFPAY